MADTSKEATELIDFLDKRTDDLFKTLNKFKQDIGTEDWALSMERSHYVFEAAARHSVFSAVFKALTAKDSKMTLESLHEHAANEMRQLASRPRHSSSPTSNLMHQETLAAWVELLERIEVRS